MSDEEQVFEFRLTIGLTVRAKAMNARVLTHALERGVWYDTEPGGWKVNPRHVVMVRPYEPPDELHRLDIDRSDL